MFYYQYFTTAVSLSEIFSIPLLAAYFRLLNDLSKLHVHVLVFNVEGQFDFGIFINLYVTSLLQTDRHNIYPRQLGCLMRSWTVQAKHAITTYESINNSFSIFILVFEIKFEFLICPQKATMRIYSTSSALLLHVLYIL